MPDTYRSIDVQAAMGQTAIGRRGAALVSLTRALIFCVLALRGESGADDSCILNGVTKTDSDGSRYRGCE